MGILALGADERVAEVSSTDSALSVAPNHLVSQAAACHT